jgi:hypothetical protein
MNYCIGFFFLCLISFVSSLTTSEVFATNAELGRTQFSTGVIGTWRIDASGDAKSKCENADAFLATITGANVNMVRTPEVVFRPFGVQIPPIDADSTARLNRITVTLYRSINGTGGVRDLTVQLVDGSDTRSDNEDMVATWGRTVANVAYVFDSNSFYSSLSIDDVQRASFGLRLSLEDGPGPRLSGSIVVHCVSVVVDYTVSSRSTTRPVAPMPTPRPAPTTRPSSGSSQQQQSSSSSQQTLPDAPSSNSTLNNSSNNNINGGADLMTSEFDGGLIAAIVLPIVFVLLCVVILVVIVLKRRKNERDTTEDKEKDTVAAYLDLSAADMRSASSPPVVVSSYGKVPGQPQHMPMDASNLPLPPVREEEAAAMMTLSDMSVAEEPASGELAFYT